jgi:ABC-type branched-subunit amino acid transport system ATPase component
VGVRWQAQPEVLRAGRAHEGIQPNVVQDIGDIIQKLKLGLRLLLVEQALPFARRVGMTRNHGSWAHCGQWSDMGELMNLCGSI